MAELPDTHDSIVFVTGKEIHVDHIASTRYPPLCTPQPVRGALSIP